MAEYDFGVIEIESSLKEQSIFIKFNLDLDEETVTYNNIYLMTLDPTINANRGVKYKIIVDGDLLQLKLEEWAVPNEQYTVLIQPGICSVTGINLEYAVVRNFIFKSDVTSKVSILSPAMYEKVSGKSFSCTWKEQGDHLENNYYLEIDTSNAFDQNVFKTNINGKQGFTTDILENGQYYLRIRSCNKEDYSYWSDTITFIVENKKEENDEQTDSPNNNQDNDNNNNDSNDDFLIIDNSLNIISVPENGITPETFEFMFNEDIDISNIEINIIRKDL